MDKDDEEMLGMMILEFMLSQKMIGKTSIRESEVYESLGIEWDDSLKDNVLELTDLGADALELYKNRSKGKPL